MNAFVMERKSNFRQTLSSCHLVQLFRVLPGSFCGGQAVAHLLTATGSPAPAPADQKITTWPGQQPTLVIVRHKAGMPPSTKAGHNK